MSARKNSYRVTLGCGHAMRVDRAGPPATGHDLYCPACQARFTVQAVECGRALPKLKRAS